MRSSDPPCSQGIDFSPALGAETEQNKETLHTTIASGKEGGETKSSIMELFDTRKQGASASAAVGAYRRGSPRLGAPSHAWASSSKTLPLSTTTGRSSAAGTSACSVGGAERHGYLSFSEVQVDEDEPDGDREEVVSFASYGSAAGSLSGSGRFGREMVQRRLKKRARAWRVFLAVMQEHGLRVRKYHRRGKGWAHRVVKYDPSLPGLRWKSSKWWDSGGGQIPLRDVLDVERRTKVVWIKCLHLGTVGFEASLETDAVIFYLAMDSLLDKRCGVEDSNRDPRFPGPTLA